MMPGRVLLTTDAVGGVWRYSLAIAAGAAARGWHCTLATMGPPPSASQRQDVAAIPRCTLLDTGLPLDWTAQNEAGMAAAAQTLHTFARNTGADTVHLHTPTLAAFSWTLPVVAVAHSCVGSWWHAVRDTPVPPDFHWRMALLREGLQAANAIIAPTQAFANALHGIYDPGRRIDVVHNGLDPATILPQPRQPRVLTAARLWDRGKNITVLDKAASGLGAPIDAAGPTAGPDGATFAATHLNLLGNLPPTRLHTEMARAAIFAAPSLYEPFGLAVLEAAQRGTPLVLADIPSFRELWTGAAIFVDPRDHQAWTDTLRSLLDAPAYRATLGAQAKYRALRYTADAMVTATLALHTVKEEQYVLF
jgi:glycosyltransferase involved in cell wall biosynthesis